MWLDISSKLFNRFFFFNTLATLLRDIDFYYFIPLSVTLVSAGGGMGGGGGGGESQGQIKAKPIGFIISHTFQSRSNMQANLRHGSFQTTLSDDAWCNG